MCTVSRNNFKRYYVENKWLFVEFLLHFWNVLEIWKSSKKKDEYPSPIISEIMDCKRGGYLNVWKVFLQKIMW